MYTLLFNKINNPVVLTEAKLQYVQLFLWSPSDRDLIVDIYLYSSGELMRLKRRREKTGKAKFGLTNVSSKTSIHDWGQGFRKGSSNIFNNWILHLFILFLCKITIPPWSCQFLFSLVSDTLIIYGTHLTLNSCTVKWNWFVLLWE